MAVPVVLAPVPVVHCGRCMHAGADKRKGRAKLPCLGGIGNAALLLVGKLEASAEAFHLTGGVNNALLSGIERMAVRADFNADQRTRGTRGERVATDTLDTRVGVVVRMDFGLHGVSSSVSVPRSEVFSAPVRKCSVLRPLCTPLPWCRSHEGEGLFHGGNAGTAPKRSALQRGYCRRKLKCSAQI